MKIYFTIIALLLLISCRSIKNETTQMKQSFSFYVGTYTSKNSQGIYKYILQKNGSLKSAGLMAVSTNPSFLTLSTDRKHLIAVNEMNINGSGSVESFLITDDSLLFKSRRPSGGADPCFVSVNDEGWVLTANYSGGNVGLLKLNGNGELSELLDIQIHSGKGLHENQKAPHAHSAIFDPENKNIISADLGTNELWFSQIDSKLQKLIPLKQQKLEMLPGAGPRHLVFHPNGKWIYVANELNCTVTLVQKISEDTYERDASLSTLPFDYKGRNSCADIHISADGRFVYVSNRGHNSIAVFNVNSLDGSLKLIAHQSTFGLEPRNFSLSPDDSYLLVANQHTDNIVSFKRDMSTGLLEYIDQIEAPTPVCLLF